MNSRIKCQEIIERLFNKGILINEEFLHKKVDDALFTKIETEADLIVLNEDYAELIAEQNCLVDWYEIDQYRVAAEKERDDELYQSHLQQFKKSMLVLRTQNLEKKQDLVGLELELGDSSNSVHFTSETAPKTTLKTTLEATPVSLKDSDGASAVLTEIKQPTSSVTVVISHQNTPQKHTVKDFANFFTSRYRFLESILRNHQELRNVLAISRVLEKKEREQIAVIGLVVEINETKSGNIIITLEDLTGTIKVLISKNKADLFREAKDLVPDEVIGVSGTCAEGFVFGERIVWPDIPGSHELKKGNNDEYVVFLSDIHVGSKLFLQEEFDRFLQWINGLAGNEEQRKMAHNVHYIIIAGDLVDGVGIYPSQEEELEIKDIKEQYAEFRRLIGQIPKDKQIIICPGNHDVVHLAEPQPVFCQEFAPGLVDFPNITLVTNPALVNVGKTETFSGFDILLYHGYSFDYYAANVESIRMNGGYHRSDLIMKFLLKRRHLAPSFTSTLYYPSHKEDPLLIKRIPDFFITGHIHYSSVANYKGITMVSGSCWQAKTTFQEKLGHEPEPARVPVVNLRTRKIKVLRFG